MKISEIMSVKSVDVQAHGSISAKIGMKVETVPVNVFDSDKGFSYQLPAGSYKDANGDTKYYHPLYPQDANAVKTAVEEAMSSGDGWKPGDGSNRYKGTAGLKGADRWVDVRLAKGGKVIMPARIGKDGKEGMVIPLKKDDPLRDTIKDKILEVVAA